jgi:hypothetical protein
MGWWNSLAMKADWVIASRGNWGMNLINLSVCVIYT